MAIGRWKLTFFSMLLTAAGAVLQGCQEGSSSGYQVPLPTEQTPRICPGETRSISASYPVILPSGTTAYASVQFIEGRNPASAQLLWSIQSNVTPSDATEADLRDSRDTAQVLFIAQRITGTSSNFPFAGNVPGLNGNVDAATAYQTIQAGAAELAFRATPTSNPQGKILLPAKNVTDWTNRTC